ncbi:uncharacterized protein TNCV_3436911 [Trichonephila clavipes]|nr:uncharacterized protein TNCV_3436911 [Trichonephila clavipes]
MMSKQHHNRPYRGLRKMASSYSSRSYLNAGESVLSPKGDYFEGGRASGLFRHVTSSSPVPLKTRRVGQRCTLNLSRAETSSRWCGVVAKKRGASSGVVHVT